MKISKETVALLAALAGLSASIVSLATTIIKTGENAARIQHASEKIETIQSCLSGQVSTRIVNPSQDAVEHVGKRISVKGRATVNETCRYLVLITHDASVPGKPWIVADLVQVNTTGAWYGNVDLDTVPIGNLAEIDARLVADPTGFIVHQSLPTPPGQGVRSNIVQVRRIQ